MSLSLHTKALEHFVLEGSGLSELRATYCLPLRPASTGLTVHTVFVENNASFLLFCANFFP
jgi:hypothetical protein